MKTCPECGETVAHEAKTCPHCRYPFRDHPLTWLLVGFVLLVVIGGWQASS